MMVALLLYAYARGVRSWRAIERACEEDVAYRVLAANHRPDHAALARFVERHEHALAGLFSEVLAMCAAAGLVKAGLIAIDGTKVAANASRDADRDYEQIAREILEEAQDVDRAEDERPLSLVRPVAAQHQAAGIGVVRPGVPFLDEQLLAV